MTTLYSLTIVIASKLLLIYKICMCGQAMYATIIIYSVFSSTSASTVTV